MVILIAGASHTGKTALSLRLAARYGFPCMSIDHLKMGLIRSGMTDLTPLSDDDALTGLLWPIVREMAKTAIENEQNLIVEGCYIPANWAEDFPPEYREHIRGVFLVMSERYIRTHFDDIVRYACVAEKRLADDVTPEEVLRDNAETLARCRRHGAEYILIDGEYAVDIEL